MKSLKKIVALVAVAALSISALTGCQKQKPIDNKEIVMTVGDKKVELGMANFFVRYQQSMMEQQMEMYQSYGYVMEWDMEVEKGKTYEESMKEDTLKSLQQLYVLDAHAADYKVALTDDETAKIEEADIENSSNPNPNKIATALGSPAISPHIPTHLPYL